MSKIQKVTLLGKGTLGSAVLEQLLNAGFTVTVLSRTPDSVKGLPSGVKVDRVDYSSVESLATALRGQDAVVSTVGPGALSSQKLTIEACILAGVKRYIPSDYGAITTDPKAQTLPINRSTVEIQQYLAEKARSGDLEYTVLATGPFLDLLISWPFAVDFQNRSVELFDGGVHPFSTTRLATIGKAIAGVLRNTEATKNRVVYVHDIVLTQAKILALAKKYSAPGEKWTETVVDSQTELDKALDGIAKGGLDQRKSMALIKAALFSGKYATEYKSVDNELLGLGFLSEEELDAMFAAKSS
ncbi:hypothetical protein PV08_10764 [Exophiala spinifera]|uniref:NAD(P)-binding domain-containing protein n=1 Tax=Exophiala spinifera TaxID=91928 RepID=A0A0D2BJF8_9EURO|nr:uncharacterized protein PV08_10764 [Exophiala spinifera]KIW11464.1 hypothetical protein PV08_10764 [Exophiala spinifera]